ncbi:hypothetical protein QTH90_21040 [Variovorax sp. J2P1-59]|uniref:hypothetical protein n=1 Tax=Variovorax flavidus TaxID=3053501 RepID=UPI002576E188|nr:hypothetical protein [Variovorax sp. J2P1-59]MDM0076908.1 hypothetical protein [Variovorax sp. J2P1-59]
MNPARNSAIGSRLADRLVAISISEADDTARLGFPPDQLDRVLEAVLTPLVSDGARIAYGGRIEIPQGMRRNYTLEIVSVLGEAYRRLDVEPGLRPFAHFIAQHRFVQRTEPAKVLNHLRALAPYGEAWLMDSERVAFIAAYIGDDMGRPRFVLKPHPAADIDGPERETFSSASELCATHAYRLLGTNVSHPALSFERMRDAMTRMCDARIVVGGRFSGFAGEMSGLTQEALFSLQQRKPVAVLGGFGGSARDIAIALGLLAVDERVPRSEHDDADRYESGLAELGRNREAFEQVAGGDLPLLKRLATEDSVVDATSLLIRYLLLRFRAQ